MLKRKGKNRVKPMVLFFKTAVPLLITIVIVGALVAGIFNRYVKQKELENSSQQTITIGTGGQNKEGHITEGEKIEGGEETEGSEGTEGSKVIEYPKDDTGLYLYKGEISHVFFHSLIADKSKAFDGDNMSNGYNYWMTTVEEFNQMLEQMYKRNYVLINIHDIVEKVDKNGKQVYQKKDLYLPIGKKPLVLSQDDVNFYKYMQKDGFANKIVIDEFGNSACEITIDGKKKVARDYDVIPLLDKFVEEHLDFSYNGAKGIIALTGYEGALGYRTNRENAGTSTYNKDRETVKAIAKALKEKGWEFASHSYGHRHMKDYPLDRFKQDTKNWEKEVGELVGPTDIYIYPYGEEIDYKGPKYKYLKKQGFNFFCGVYAKPWIEINNDFVRMTRRNLDGFTMHFYPERVKDLYDINKVYDKSRPEFK